MARWVIKSGTCDSVYQISLTLIDDFNKGDVLISFNIEGLIPSSVVLNSFKEILHCGFLAHTNIIRTINLNFLQREQVTGPV